ncbi:MAG TPA: hypothetical protein DCK93_20515 [Blastocatellia bacterium]|jgi:predicted DNA-binding transcriptional regulator AlpA|nr:hypothetical protein [Blastocatellia bacterium]
MNRERKKEFSEIGPADISMLNVKELEAFLKIDQKTIYRYVSLGLIPYVRIQSNIRFVRKQILAWIEEQNYQPNRITFTDRSDR